MARRICAAVVLVACSAASATVQQAPAFEVATIRTSTADSPPLALQRQPGGRLVTFNTPLTFLIGWAFGLDGDRVVGAPKGTDSANFDIVAKAPTEDLRPGDLGLTVPPEAPDPNPFSMTDAGVLKGRRVTMDMLAKALSSQLRAPVENGNAPIGDNSKPSLFTAIREQLGLRLDVRRIPVDVIVVDRLSLAPTPD